MTDPNATVSIRKATPHDVEIIRHIAFVTWPVAYASILTKDAMDYMLGYFYCPEALQQQMDEGQLFFIAAQGGIDIGFASFTRMDTQTAKLNKLYVLPHQQKTGAGRLLLHHVLTLAKEKGACSLILNVNRNNEAIGFYKKMGFEILYTEDVDLGNNVIQEDYVMGCRL